MSKESAMDSAVVVRQPPEGGYWNPVTETMPREQLRGLQWHKLRTSLDHARHGSPFWRSRIPDGIGSLEDYLARMPILTRDQILEAEAVNPPYGDFASCDPRLAIRHHQTSGTSGKPPVRTFDTARDWAWAADMWCTGLYGMGVRSYDRAAVAFGNGLFIGFWGLHQALEKIGVTTVPTGSFDAEDRVRLLLEHGITVLACTPTHALGLALTARRMGIDLARESRVRIVVCSGEPRPESTKRAISDAFGAFAGDTAGMTEAATIFMFECPEEPGGCHLIESDFIEEVIDPDTLRPVPYGEPGVRVMTSLGREGIQTFRYWTNDLVVRRPWTDCSCGRTWDLYEGGVRGRHDEMRKVRGVFFMPVMVEDVVRAFPEVEEFQSSLRTIEDLDALVVRIEPRPDVPEERHSELEGRVRREIKQQLSLTPIVEIAAPGSLPRFEMKARRFQDERAGAPSPS
jgi:phenylacetate-coenzyme A ligase PaaK-like adenylate-forming protein